jgi:AcrR family transcriptional regulator
MTSLKIKSAQLRREHIVAAAIKVFTLKGYHRATIRDIAKEAGLADGTIYLSFANKEALLIAVLDPLDEANAPMLAIERNINLREFLGKALTHRFASLTPDKLDVLRVVLSEALVNEELRAVYVERVLAPTLKLSIPPLADQIDTTAPDPALILRIMVGAVTGLVMLRLLGDTVTETHWAKLGDTLAEALFGTLPDRQTAKTQGGIST